MNSVKSAGTLGRSAVGPKFVWVCKHLCVAAVIGTHEVGELTGSTAGFMKAVVAGRHQAFTSRGSARADRVQLLHQEAEHGQAPRVRGLIAGMTIAFWALR